MKLLELQGKAIVAELSATELLLINNALNEVCDGVEIADFEFQTRLGVGREEARALLSQIGQVLRTWPRAPS